jgi:hypothetical protein
MQSVPTKKLGRGRLWLLHPIVLPRSTGRCTTTAPPIHFDSCTSTSISVRSSSGLPAHLSASTSEQRPRPYLHLHLPTPPTAGAASDHISFNYGRSGHFARECTAPKKNATQGHVTHPPHGPPKVAIVKTGRVNYTAMEDIPKGEQVLTGIFSLNGHPAVIVFDSGATHDFISKACIQKSQLAIQHMSTLYLIKTSGDKICTNQLVKNAPLNLGGKEYKTCLIVLEGQGIDIILGMGWMKVDKALLDTATRVV